MESQKGLIVQQFQEWSKGQVIYIKRSFGLNDGMEQENVVKLEKSNNFNEDLLIFQTRKAFLSNYLKPTKDRLTIKFFGQACIKANLSDKQSSNPHDYF